MKRLIKLCKFLINDLWHSEYRNVKLIVFLVDFQMKLRNKECFLLSLHRNMDKKYNYGRYS